jgi:hypothetical protein
VSPGSEPQSQRDTSGTKGHSSHTIIRKIAGSQPSKGKPTQTQDMTSSLKHTWPPEICPPMLPKPLNTAMPMAGKFLDLRYLHALLQTPSRPSRLPRVQGCLGHCCWEPKLWHLQTPHLPPQMTQMTKDAWRKQVNTSSTTHHSPPGIKLRGPQGPQHAQRVQGLDRHRVAANCTALQQCRANHISTSRMC